MFATGRQPNTRNLGLEAAGVTLADGGAIVVDHSSDLVSTLKHHAPLLAASRAAGWQKRKALRRAKSSSLEVTVLPILHCGFLICLGSEWCRRVSSRVIAAAEQRP